MSIKNIELKELLNMCGDGKIDYGTGFCKNSPTIGESLLYDEQLILLMMKKENNLIR